MTLEDQHSLGRLWRKGSHEALEGKGVDASARTDAIHRIGLGSRLEANPTTVPSMVRTTTNSVRTSETLTKAF